MILLKIDCVSRNNNDEKYMCQCSLCDEKYRFK